VTDFNIDDYLNSPETKAFVWAKREEIMGPPPAPPIALRDEPEQIRTANVILLKSTNGAPVASPP
jgi:hypothetical protein